ncbi:prominin-1-A-like [Solea senegalensis]|uniref:Prominin-1-A-like n=2 Tax=Solea senegalensis TaxID=28829 RepID=A0AAV6S3Y8_SOLSE|nr:prominin-1-A-like [Solea senegalensis]
MRREQTSEMSSLVKPMNHTSIPDIFVLIKILAHSQLHKLSTQSDDIKFLQVCKSVCVCVCVSELLERRAVATVLHCPAKSLYEDAFHVCPLNRAYLSESMRACRRPSSGGALRTVVGAMLLTLGLSQSGPQQTPCMAGDARQNLTQLKYLMFQNRTASSFMTPLVESFLQTVQPYPFPIDLILKLVREFSLTNSQLIKEVMLHEVGFLVCAIFGILYIILMPIIGIFLACCRCCGKCGGTMHQKQTPSIHSSRRCLYWCTIAVTVIILAGNVCMFKSNKDLNVGVTQSPTQLNTTTRNIQTFITSVPQQIQSVVNESFTTIDRIASNLNDIGPQLGSVIQDRFRGHMDPVLHSLRLLNEGTTNFSAQLQELNSFLTQHRTTMNLLQRDITTIRYAITATLNNPACVGCALIRPVLQPQVDRLTLGAIVTPNTDGLVAGMTQINQTDLPSKIVEIERYFNSIPQTVNTETMNVVQQTTQVLENVKTQISNIIRTSLSAFINLSELPTQLYADTIGKHSSTIEYAEDIRYKLCIVLCCVVGLVVMCNLLGLVLGPLGLKPKTDPTMRSCMADSGGTFFMMSAGFSFLFSWLMMVLVLVLFLLGGHGHTLVCRPWSSGQLFQLIDSSGLVPNISQVLGLRSNISIAHIYRGCTANQTIWKTLLMHEVIDLDQVFSTTQYLGDIQQQFDAMHIGLPAITFLSPEVRENLGNLSIITNGMNSTLITQQINTVSNINLNTSADALVNAGIATDPPTQTRLQNHANDLRQIQARIETTLIPQMTQLNSSVTVLRTKEQEIEASVAVLLANVAAAEGFFNTEAAAVVRNESSSFLDCQLAHFDHYNVWARLMITEQMGFCKPVAETVDAVEVILCSYLLESLNAFWCSMGWCLFFLIPSIIFTIKLAKYYRKMKLSDDYE